MFRVPSVSGDQSTVQSFLIDGIYPRPGCCIRCRFYVLPRATDTHCQHARRALNYAYPCQTRRYGITYKPLKTANDAVAQWFFLIRCESDISDQGYKVYGVDVGFSHFPLFIFNRRLWRTWNRVSFSYIKNLMCNHSCSVQLFKSHLIRRFALNCVLINRMQLKCKWEIKTVKIIHTDISFAISANSNLSRLPEHGDFIASRHSRARISVPRAS